MPRPLEHAKLARVLEHGLPGLEHARAQHLLNVRNLNEQVAGLTEALRVDHEHAQKERQEFKLLKTCIEEISRDQSRVGMRWDWAAGPLHDVAVAIR